MDALSNWLTGFGLADFVNAYDWVWPVCEIFHFIGMAMLIGTVGLLDIRILGLAKGLPIDKLEKLMPIGVAGFILNLVTGIVFVAGNPTGGPIAYLDNLAFQIKVVLMLVAGVNLAAFYLTGISGRAAAVGPAGDADRGARLVAAASLLLWFGVIFFGRMIMYNDTLLLFLGL